MAFQLRNSVPFLSLIFQKLVPTETLNVVKASVMRGFTPFKNFWVETKGGIRFVNFHIERKGWCFYLLHSTLLCLAFPRLRVMGFISPVAFETPDREIKQE